MQCKYFSQIHLIKLYEPSTQKKIIRNLTDKRVDVVRSEIVVNVRILTLLHVSDFSNGYRLFYQSIKKKKIIWMYFDKKKII